MPLLFSTDASEKKGAICSSRISPSLSSKLWRSTDRKGGYSRLASRAQAVLKRIDPLWEEAPPEEPVQCPCRRPFAFTFDFIELFSQGAEITKEVASLGWLTGPVVHSSRSSFFLIYNDRVRAISISLPAQVSPCALAPGQAADGARARWTTFCRGLAVLLKCLRSRVSALALLPASTHMAR